MEKNDERPVDRIKDFANWLIENKIIKSMYAFEKLCGLSHFYIKNLSATEKGNPGVDTIAKIYEVFPVVSLEWLVAGKGKMFKAKGTDEEIGNMIKIRIINKLL